MLLKIINRKYIKVANYTLMGPCKALMINGKNVCNYEWATITSGWASAILAIDIAAAILTLTSLS